MSVLWQEESYDESDPSKVVHIRDLPLEGTFDAGWFGKEIKSAQGLREAIVKAGGPEPVGIKVFIDPATKKPVADKRYGNVSFHSEADAKAFLALAKKDSRLKLAGHECTALPHNGSLSSGGSVLVVSVWGAPAPPPPAAVASKQYADADEDPHFVHDERTLYVSGIPVRATDGAYIKSRGELKKQIEGQSQSGSVHSVKMYRNETGDYSGVALVTMVDTHFANKMKTLRIGQKTVNVKPADRPSTAQPQQQPKTHHIVNSDQSPAAGRLTGQERQIGGKAQKAQMPAAGRVRLDDEGQDLQRGLATWRHSQSRVLKRQLMRLDHSVNKIGDEAPYSGTGGGAPAPEADSFTILSWNVLFSDYAKNHGYCKPEHLAFEYRLGLIQGCIQSHKPDILALQEVETADPNQKALAGMLRAEGYRSAFVPKRDGARVSDGMLLAWQSDKFALPQGPGEKFLNFDCGLAAKFETLDPPGRSLVVCSTHLKAGASEEDRRIGQMMTMLSRVADFWPNTPTIVAGDFNTEPEWDLIPQLSAGSPIGPLRSGYPDRSCFTDRPFTTYSWFAQSVMDYILFTPRTLAPAEVLKLPGVRDVVRMCEDDYPTPPPGPTFRMLPSKSFPSDHLPLLCRMTFQRERESGRVKTRDETRDEDSIAAAFRKDVPSKQGPAATKKSAWPTEATSLSRREDTPPSRVHYSEVEVSDDSAETQKEPPAVRYSEEEWSQGPRWEEQKQAPTADPVASGGKGAGGQSEGRSRTPEQPDTRTASPSASFARGSSIREVDSKTDDL